jgi:hypothetical protein
MINELDRVVLKTDFPEKGLVAGDVGTVVHAYAAGKGYEVEFSTLAGDSVAVVTVRAEQVRPAGSREIAHARSVS